jgi:NTP-dependent ternary system trypsin peptidase co-occuring protein
VGSTANRAQKEGEMPEEISAGLAETIRALRSQLSDAMDEGRGKDLLFELGDVELEFQVGVTKDTSAEGGVRFWILSLGAKGSVAAEATHRIALKLKPVIVDGSGIHQPARVADVVPAAPL